MPPICSNTIEITMINFYKALQNFELCVPAADNLWLSLGGAGENQLLSSPAQVEHNSQI